MACEARRRRRCAGCCAAGGEAGVKRGMPAAHMPPCREQAYIYARRREPRRALAYPAKILVEEECAAAWFMLLFQHGAFAATRVFATSRARASTASHYAASPASAA